MSGLGLVPNEIVGYRLKPDWYSWNVVLVKRHGPSSKQAGTEYDTPLAYCKNLEFAVSWMFNHALRMRGEQRQADALAVAGSVADAEALRDAIAPAKADVLAAIKRLQAELDAAGLKNKEVIKMLGAPADAEPAG